MYSSTLQLILLKLTGVESPKVLLSQFPTEVRQHLNFAYFSFFNMLLCASATAIFCISHFNLSFIPSTLLMVFSALIFNRLEIIVGSPNLRFSSFLKILIVSPAVILIAVSHSSIIFQNDISNQFNIEQKRAINNKLDFNTICKIKTETKQLELQLQAAYKAYENAIRRYKNYQLQPRTLQKQQKAKARTQAKVDHYLNVHTEVSIQLETLKMQRNLLIQKANIKRKQSGELGFPSNFSIFKILFQFKIPTASLFTIMIILLMIVPTIIRIKMPNIHYHTFLQQLKQQEALHASIELESEQKRWEERRRYWSMDDLLHSTTSNDNITPL